MADYPISKEAITKELIDLKKMLGNSYASIAVNMVIDRLNGFPQMEVQAPEWISVEERLPEKGERVLVTNGPKGGFVCESYLNVNGKWMRAGCELVFMTPHYWMHLPEPPKQGGTE